ncbi:MAG: hypothetical protein WC340_05865 [Kiritimatiellia bacterium]
MEQTHPISPPSTDNALKAEGLTARVFNSGFREAHDTYNALSIASDGNVYYVLCSTSIDFGGRVFRYDPRTDKITFVGDLTEFCGEKGLKTVPQGKSHVLFYEYEGKLYFSTHAGYYNTAGGMERMATEVPPGYKVYPGGHLLTYDLKSGAHEDLGIAPEREAVLAMSMDTQRGVIYGISWPIGYFFRYDVATKKMTNLGPTASQGESGEGSTYRVLCRSIAIDPESGCAYFTNPEGDIFCYRPNAERVEKVEGEDMRKDYFGKYEPTDSGSMGYNWRQLVWHPDEKVFYGVHGNSGYLFRFDPKATRIEVLDRITSEPSQRSGMGDQFSYGYLGFTLGPDGRTLYYLTGGPIYENGKRVKGREKVATGMAKGIENLHLVTYDIPTQGYKDHGPVFYPDGQRPLYVNSIAVAADGTVYTLARVTENGHMRTDLVQIKTGAQGTDMRRDALRAQRRRWKRF